MASQSLPADLGVLDVDMQPDQRGPVLQGGLLHRGVLHDSSKPHSTLHQLLESRLAPIASVVRGVPGVPAAYIEFAGELSAGHSSTAQLHSSRAALKSCNCKA